MAFDRVLYGERRTWITTGVPIGAGMSMVYAVADEETSIRAFAKVQRPSFAGDRSTSIPHSTLFHERDILLALASLSRIPQVLDAGMTDAGKSAVPFIILSACPGSPLQFSHRLPEHDIISILLELAQIVAQIHDRGILHCDIQPSNVHCTQNHALSLLDFGLSRWYTQDDPFAFCGGFSPYFTAPELLRGEWGTPASDCWSIGALAWYLHLGKLPASFSMSGYPPLTPQTTGWQMGTCMLFNRCVAPRIQDRISSAHTLAERLAELAFTLRKKDCSTRSQGM